MPLPQVQTNLPSLIGDAIRDRFYKQQLDMFMQNEYAEYQSELNNLSAALADPSDPDMASKILQSYKSSTNKMLVNATRYAKNPYIAQLAQAHFQHDMQQFDSIVKLSEQAQAAESGPTAKDEALTKKYEAEAELAEKRGEKAEAETRALATQPKLANNYWDNWDISSPSVALGALNRVDSKGLNERRDREMNEIRHSMANVQIQALAASKQPNPQTGQPWGMGGFDEVKQVAATLPPERVREMWEMRALKNDLPQKTGMTEEQIEMMFPQYDWPKKMTTATIPRGALAPEQVGKLVFGGGFETVMGGQVIVKNIQDIAKNLPNDINALGPNIVTDLFNATYQAGGNNPDTQVPFNNYKEYRAWLQKSARQWVNSQIGGLEISDAELDPETRASRQKTKALLDMAIEKYSGHVARELRIPKAPEAPAGFFGRLIPPEAKGFVTGVTEKLFGEVQVGPRPEVISQTVPGVKAPAEKKPAPPAILDVTRVMVPTLDTPTQNKYFRVLQAFMGATDFPDWDPVGPNKNGDLIIKNSKTGKTSLATWDGEIIPVTGLKKPKKK